MNPDQRYTIEFASQGMLENLLDLHMLCFAPKDQMMRRFGRGFLRAVYQWLLSEPRDRVIVASHCERPIGVTVISKLGYMKRMIVSCKWSFLKAILVNPRLLYDRELWAYASSCFAKKTDLSDLEGLCQIVFTHVHPHFRGAGVSSALKLRSIEVAEELGYAGLYTRVRRLNSASRKMNERAGFVECPILSDERFVGYVFRF